MKKLTDAKAVNIRRMTNVIMVSAKATAVEKMDINTAAIMIVFFLPTLSETMPEREAPIKIPSMYKD